mmetsp:Transcript_35717/g.98799  ORF Transcript_35717/g.98799 Transcript_35717/m.98799 type:complete len:116 (+) Transcript_35717:151-498(+)
MTSAENAAAENAGRGFELLPWQDAWLADPVIEHWFDQWLDQRAKYLLEKERPPQAARVSDVSDRGRVSGWQQRQAWAPPPSDGQADAWGLVAASGGGSWAPDWAHPIRFSGRGHP